MKIASVADVKAHFSAYLRSAVRGPVVVTRGGRPAGVLLAIDDEEELERLVLAYSPRLRTILNAARQRLRAGAGIPHEDFWQEVECDPKRRRQTGPHRKST
jgi:prevent-host-death family protein